MQFLPPYIKVVLTVKTGLHAGAALALARDTAVGQADGNLMRLLDDGIADQHARLTLHQNGLTITPLSGDVTIGGTAHFGSAVQRLAPGGSIDVGFGPVIASLTRKERRGPRSVNLLGLMLMACAIVLPLPWHGDATSASTVQLWVQAPAAAARPTHQQITRLVTQRFAQLQLDRTMQITVDGANGRALSTTIAGVVEPANLPDFEAFLTWYDAQPGWPALFNLTKHQDPAARQLPLISAVLLHPMPAIVTDTGIRIGVGDAMPGGWVVTSVDAGAVVLTIDGQAHVLTLGKPADATVETTADAHAP